MSVEVVHKGHPDYDRLTTDHKLNELPQLADLENLPNGVSKGNEVQLGGSELATVPKLNPSPPGQTRSEPQPEKLTTEQLREVILNTPTPEPVPEALPWRKKQLPDGVGGILALIAAAMWEYFFVIYFKRLLVQYPKFAIFFITGEWMTLAVPAIFGFALLIGEGRTSLPPLPTATEFIERLRVGKIRIRHDEMIDLAKVLDGKMKVAGQTISVKVINPKEKNAGLVVERGLG